MTPDQYTPEDPISSIATALAPAALGIVRASGKGCIELVSKIFSRPKALLEAAGNTLVYGWIVDKGGESLPLAPAGKPSSATPSNGGQAPRNAPLGSSASATSGAPTQLSWEEQKRLESERRKLEKEVSRLEAQISELEAKKSDLEAKLALPEVYTNGEKAKAVQREIEVLTSQIDETTAAWEEAAEKLG